MTPAIGTRRPREGRCAHCDKPLSDEVYESFQPIMFTGPLTWRSGPTEMEWCPAEDQPDRCAGEEHLCAGPSVDWRARALAAEAALKDAEGREALAVSMWNETELAARAATRGDASEPRDVSTDFGIDLFLVVQKTIADAEARGRTHGLLAAAIRLDDLVWCRCDRSWTDRKRHSPDCMDWLVDEIIELAAESTDGR